MEKKKLLVACEYSQTVTTAFLNRGWDAYSCDLLPCEGDHPDRHLQMDARDAVSKNDWDLVIAHPSCTYLCVVGWTAVSRYKMDIEERYRQMNEAAKFFMWFWNNVKCPLCIENPRPVHRAQLPRETQYVDPTMFGDTYTKRTYLWLKDLPPLLPTTAKPAQTKSLVFSKRGGHNRSKLSVYLANAMCEQWSPLFGL